MKKNLVLLIFLFVLILPLISAQSGYNLSFIENLRQSELLNFCVFFLIIFGICYLVLEKFFHIDINNRPIVVMILLLLAFFAAQGLITYQKSFLVTTGYWWIFLIFAILSILLVLKGIKKVNLGFFWVCAGFSIIWFILKVIIRPNIPYIIDTALTQATYTTAFIAVLGMAQHFFKRPEEKLKEAEAREKIIKTKGLEKEAEKKSKLFREKALKKAKEVAREELTKEYDALVRAALREKKLDKAQKLEKRKRRELEKLK